jgi:two-component system, response regulator
MLNSKDADLVMPAEESYKVVLLIEDNADDIELTLRTFKQCNLVNKVVVARDGAEALAYVSSLRETKRDNHPVLVILDLNLPKVNGLEVLRHIRQNELTKYIPVAVLTTSQDEEDRIRSYDLGANSYVRKPVVFNQFSEAVRHLGLFWLLINDQPQRSEQQIVIQPAP